MKMVLVTVNNNQFYMDGYHKQNIDYVIPKVINQNYKFMGFADGRSGYGKTTFIAQSAYYASKGKITLDHVCFNKEQVLNCLSNSKTGDNIIGDEMFAVANKRNARGDKNQEVLEEFQKMRVHKVFFWGALPIVYDLDKNVILGLIDAFYHVYGKPFNRSGKFAAYDEIGLKKLWLKCRQDINYSKSVAMPNFIGRFTSWFPFDVDEYEDKKKKSKPLDEEFTNKYITQRNKLINFLYTQKYSIDQICLLCDLKSSAVYDIIAKFK